MSKHFVPPARQPVDPSTAWWRRMLHRLRNIAVSPYQLWAREDR